MRYLLFAIWLSHTTALFAQKMVPYNIVAEQSNPHISIEQCLSGVEYALIEMSPKDQRDTDEKGNAFLARFRTYLQEMGIKQVFFTTIEKQNLQDTVSSLCKIVKVRVMGKRKEQYIWGNVVEYRTCTGDRFSFSSPDTLYADAYLVDKFFTLWEQMYSKKITYNPEKRLKLTQRPTLWSQEALKKYLSSASVDDIEGIYEKIPSNTTEHQKHTIAIVKNDQGNGYQALYIGGASNYLDWTPFELIGQLSKTATQHYFAVTWYMPDKTTNDRVFVSPDNTLKLHFSFTDKEEGAIYYIKVFPQINSPVQDNSPPKSTGTGIAISEDGYIATNYHVIEGGTRFWVSIFKDGAQQNYEAKLAKKDAASDLAILKIEDFNFKTLPDLPFAVKKELCEVGESVFTIGFPLSNSMGIEPKMTEGSISSRTGFNDDVATYQVSAPVQPGNSGGPLFDKKGNLIGIIKAKHVQAENATYAIKIRSIDGLLELLPKPVKLPEKNQLNGQDFTEQIKKLRNYVFFIKVWEE